MMVRVWGNKALALDLFYFQRYILLIMVNPFKMASARIVTYFVRSTS